MPVPCNLPFGQRMLTSAQGGGGGRFMRVRRIQIWRHDFELLRQRIELTSIAPHDRAELGDLRLHLV